jgi:hypothetical protein
MGFVFRMSFVFPISFGGSRLWGSHQGAEAEGHQLYFAIWMGVAIAAAMFLLKIAQEIFRGWKVELISLAAIADVDAATKMRSSLPRLVAKIFGSIFFQGGKFAIQGLRGNFA